MAIQVGDKIPSVTLKHLTDEGMQEVTTDELFGGKTVALFAVPGAFTPTCSAKHLPGYIEQADALKAKGVDAIVCLAVNDPFVMKEWGKASDAGDKVFLLPDGNGDLTRAIGMEMDGTGYGLGHRAKRFAAVVKDGTVTHLAEEPAGGVTVSGAEAILEVL
ncbi:MAG: peroxiredoxin [Rhodospirillaceae bacterium]|nr:peroxiredoxin [Rhodospirillaceae bacterium]MCA8931826.1 peroxiredoxin [Rhodospirillaceae bacterium]